MKFIFLLLVFLGFTTACVSQSNNNESKTVNLTHTVRVNLENEDIKRVFELWRSYLSSSPQNNTGSEYWSNQQKDIWPDADLTRSLINYQLLSHYEPHVLSIEAKKDVWEIRTLYRTTSQEERFQSSNPWAIQTVYAGYENEELRLFNALPLRTSDWDTTSYENVLYYYPSEFSFDIFEAEKTQDFINEVSEEFKLKVPEQIYFYLSDHPDDTMYIMGFDFILGPTMGFANVHNNMIFSGIGSAWYPHELTHILFKEFDPPHFLSEGIATMLGGTMSHEPDQVYKKLKEFIDDEPEITLKQIIDTQFFDGTNLYYYAAGASICEFVYRENGPQELVLMLKTVRSNEDLFTYLQDLMDHSAFEIEDWWRGFVTDLAYSNY